MRILEVPLIDKDDNITAIVQLKMEEAQTLLQFALNFLASSGLAVNYAIKDKIDEEADDRPTQLDMDFDPTKLN